MFDLIDFEYRFGRSLDSLVSDDRGVIVVGVSGGADSMVLLGLLLKYLSADRLVVAHCNFSLRGEEADSESRMVERFCAERGVHFEMARFDTYALCAERGEGVQVVARELRYGFFDRLLSKYQASYVAIAHHRDDANETFFINLLRGTGLKGLLSIPERRDRVIRPLLYARAQQIREYAKREGLPYLDDSSNADTHYLRNKLRHRVLPSLREIHSGFDQTMSENIERLTQSYNFEQQIIEKARERVFSGGSLSIEKFAQEDGEGVYLLYSLLRSKGFSWDSCQRIYTDITQGKGQGNIYHAPTCKALIDRGWVIFKEEQNQIEGQRSLTPEDIEILDPRSVESYRATKQYCYFDYDQLKFPLEVRRWQKGDRIAPYGMGGRSKLVSDLLIDSKVSRFAKEQQLVVVDAQGVILWVVGVRSSEQCSITPSSRLIAKINL
ncbi:MAG: tRNA lysidine(34) synthetase TilS [Rikenellaceae bacterium]